MITRPGSNPFPGLRPFMQEEADLFFGRDRQSDELVRRLASQDSQVYAPRRAQLDEHGRLTPQPRATQEDDQLEIPAFLRRQAN